MKKYTLTAAEAFNHTPEHPERTARKYIGLFAETAVFQVWPNRPSMAKTIRMQQKREHRSDDWNPCVPLTIAEGY